MPSKYILEVYNPRSKKDVWLSWESKSPFMAISAGDVINPTTWPGAESPVNLLRVTRVEHVIWGGLEEAKHKVMVYTEETDTAA